ncbi:13403_t:CDS:2 [Racocetra fulgida]|uniref:13403_t:CDS:1 n=1 Tax=Racocetra fulgida TaxID=60492 RepID=A0A9N8WFV3_9GLOM|nr:13403_t:CDS:2 [Racocetra fulgida]
MHQIIKIDILNTKVLAKFFKEIIYYSTNAAYQNSKRYDSIQERLSN